MSESKKIRLIVTVAGATLLIVLMTVISHMDNNFIKKCMETGHTQEHCERTVHGY